jgi:iron complex transport system ATP-binding protein
MALAQEGDVLLLDEPTVHLDPAHQRATLDLVRRVTRSRALVTLAVLHDLNLAAAMCDRIVVLDSGRVVRDGPPGDVLDPATVTRVFGPGLDVGIREGVPYVLPGR